MGLERGAAKTGELAPANAAVNVKMIDRRDSMMSLSFFCSPRGKADCKANIAATPIRHRAFGRASHREARTAGGKICPVVKAPIGPPPPLQP
jgi:hypothetical protein